MTDVGRRSPLPAMRRVAPRVAHGKAFCFGERFECPYKTKAYTTLSVLPRVFRLRNKLAYILECLTNYSRADRRKVFCRGKRQSTILNYRDFPHRR